MLRYFDNLDILKPVKVDELTGYQYFESSQLLVAAKIVSYQKMGFSLQEITLLLSNQELYHKNNN